MALSMTRKRKPTIRYMHVQESKGNNAGVERCARAALPAALPWAYKFIKAIIRRQRVRAELRRQGLCRMLALGAAADCSLRCSAID